MTSFSLNSGTVGGVPGIFCEIVKLKRCVFVSVTLTANSTSRESWAWCESATFVTEIDSVSWIDLLATVRNISISAEWRQAYSEHWSFDVNPERIHQLTRERGPIDRKQRIESPTPERVVQECSISARFDVLTGQRPADPQGPIRYIHTRRVSMPSQV